MWSIAAQCSFNLIACPKHLQHLTLSCLQGCAALSHLHLVFDEWAYCNITCVGAIQTLHILCLEPDSVASLEYRTLYKLGPHVSILRLLGRAASLSFVEVPDWKDFLFTLFGTLSNLECFETTQDARALVAAASLHSQEEGSAAICDNLLILRFWHLYVVVDRHSSALRGVLRRKDSVGLLHNTSVK